MANYPVYAIRKMGGRRVRFAIVRAYEGGCSAPMDGQLYRSEEAAQAAAAAAGIEISVSGDGLAIAAYMHRSYVYRVYQAAQEIEARSTAARLLYVSVDADGNTESAVYQL